MKKLIILPLILMTVSIAVPVYAADKPGTSQPVSGGQAGQAESLFETGAKAYSSGDFVAALDSLNKAIGYKPDYYEAYVYRGLTYYHGINEFNKAQKDFAKAIKLKPKVSLAYYMRAGVYKEQRMYKEAMADMDAAIAYSDDKQIADFYEAKKDDIAKEYYEVEARAKSAPEDNDKQKITTYQDVENNNAREKKGHPKAYALYERANGKYDAKNYKGAIEDYNKAIALSPDYPEYYWQRGRAKNWLQDYKGNIEDQDKAISLNPTRGAYYYNRGLGKGYLSDWAGQVNDYAKAASLDPIYTDDRDYAKNQLITLFFDSAVYNDKAAITRLIENKIDVNTEYGGTTALILAVSNDNRDIAKLLLKHGANANAKDTDGNTPLHWAAGKGYKEMVNLLLTNGANVNANNNKGYTPLVYAENQGSVEITGILKSHGAVR